MPTIKRLRWISAAAWLFSWRVVYLEIFRWHHMTKTLRFNPPPVPPGMNVAPKAGLPLKAVCVCAIAAPVVFLGTWVTPDRAARLSKSGVGPPR